MEMLKIKYLGNEAWGAGGYVGDFSCNINQTVEVEAHKAKRVLKKSPNSWKIAGACVKPTLVPVKKKVVEAENKVIKTVEAKKETVKPTIRPSRRRG